MTVVHYCSHLMEEEVLEVYLMLWHVDVTVLSRTCTSIIYSSNFLLVSIRFLGVYLLVQIL